MKLKYRRLLLFSVGCVSVVGLALTIHVSRLWTRDKVPHTDNISLTTKLDDLLQPEVLAEQRQRQRRLSAVCSRLQLSGTVPNSLAPGWTMDDDMLVDDKLRYIYCPIGKVATRSWKYVLLRAAGSDVTMQKADNRHVINKYLHQLRRYLKEPGAVEHRLSTYYKFFVVRDPMERFVSAYNYLFHGSSYYQMRHGRRIIKRYRPNATETALTTGKLVTITEFVRYVLDENAAGNRGDRHWQPQYQLCHPCHIRYNYVAHLETIDMDASAILRQLGVKDEVAGRFPTMKRPRTTQSFARRALASVPVADRKQLINLYRPDYELFNFTVDMNLLADVLDIDSFLPDD